MQLPASLVDAVRDGSLVPFVGAGLSTSVNRDLFPQWGALVGHLAARVGDEFGAAERDAVRALIDQQKLVDAAEHAVRLLRASRFADEMRRWFGHDVEDAFLHRRGADLSAVAALWRLRPRFVITTNYDRVLEWPYDCGQAPPGPRPQRVLNGNRASIQALVGLTPPDEPLVWHLHGQIDQAESLILTQRQYDLLYGEQDARLADYEFAGTMLASLFATRPLLFVGFSLQDAAVRQQLAEMRALARGTGPVSYLLLREGDGGAEAEAFLESLDVQVVRFAGFGAPLAAWINALAAKAWEGEPVVLPPPLGNLLERDEPLPPGRERLATTLVRALSRVALPAAVVAQAYNRTKERGDGWRPLPLNGDGVLLLRRGIVQSCHVGSLAPLATFLEALRADVAALGAAAADGTSLRALHDEWDGALAGAVRTVAAEGAGAPRPSAPAPPPVADPYALVRIEHARGSSRVHLVGWLFGGDVPRRFLDTAGDLETADGLDPGDAGELAYRLVRALREQGVEDETATIAFELPRARLCTPVEHWRTSVRRTGRRPPIGVLQAVTVRAAQRVAEPVWWGDVRSRWTLLKGRGDAPLRLVDPADAAPDTAVWLTPAEAERDETLDRVVFSGAPCVVIAGSPADEPGESGDFLDRVLETSVPVVFWVRVQPGAAPPSRESVRAIVEGTPARALPRALREHRRQAAQAGDAAHLGRCLVLLWDDADRVAPDRDAANEFILSR